MATEATSISVSGSNSAVVGASTAVSPVVDQYVIFNVQGELPANEGFLATHEDIVRLAELPLSSFNVTIPRHLNS